MRQPGPENHHALLYSADRAAGKLTELMPWYCTMDWDQYAVMIIRSPGGYKNQLAEFMQVMARIEHSRARLLI